MIRSVQRHSASSKRFGFVMACSIVVLFIGSGAASAQNYKVDAVDSQSLTVYLRQHRLPLVGAQVLNGSSGNRRIVLYGFAATEFGKNDAAAKALTYIENKTPNSIPAPQIENHIEVRPEIARMKPPNATPTGSTSANESLDHVLNDIDRFGVTMAPESYTQ